MIELIKKVAKQTQETLNPVELMEAVVVSAPPELSLKLKNNSKLIILKEQLVVAEHLTRHKRIVTIEHLEMAERELGDKIAYDYINTDDKQPPYSSFQYNFLEMQFEDVLKEGDRVLVASFQGGQKFYVMDRLITY